MPRRSLGSDENSFVLEYNWAGFRNVTKLLVSKGESTASARGLAKQLVRGHFCVPDGT